MIDDYIRLHAEKTPNAPAILGGSEAAIPFWKYEADIRRAVHELGDLKVEPGQSVSVATRKVYINWILELALARLGIASAPHSDVKSPYRITDDPQEPGTNVLFLSEARIQSLFTGPEREFVRRNADPEVLARIFHTSGTTGTPKRIAVSWRVVSAFTMSLVKWLGDRPGTWGGMIPMHTPGGYYGALAAAVCGCPNVMTSLPLVEFVLSIKPRILGLLPIHIQFLLDNLPKDTPKWPVTVVSGGSALPAEMGAALRERLTSDVVSSYGASESGMCAVKDLDLMEREPLAAGHVIPGARVRIVDDQGKELPFGELGQICMSSPTVAMGYLDDPEATARHFRDGWFHSTDLGRLREDGLLFVEGRADELMNLGGHKVLPEPIDVAVGRCPGVKEAAAFSFAGEGGVDRCGIAIAAGEGYDEAAVRKAVRKQLWKVQRIEIMLVDSLPRNAMAKVERLQLRDMMQQKIAAAPSAEKTE